MINSDAFTKRLQQVIEYYGESASSFAEKIGVQRSSISHILSGRNKPSLEFVLKILSAFPEVELYWLLNGKGIFPKTKQTPPIQTTDELPKDLFSTEKSDKETPPDHTVTPNKQIERIVVFYSDGSFKNYEN
jgi:transcriptional regulator with XRE-family HTH domain